MPSFNLGVRRPLGDPLISLMCENHTLKCQGKVKIIYTDFTLAPDARMRCWPSIHMVKETEGLKSVTLFLYREKLSRQVNRTTLQKGSPRILGQGGCAAGPQPACGGIFQDICHRAWPGIFQPRLKYSGQFHNFPPEIITFRLKPLKASFRSELLVIHKKGG
jgi:hypothetical protein